MTTMYRKQKLIQELWTSAIEKANFQISSPRVGYVPEADIQLGNDLGLHHQ